MTVLESLVQAGVTDVELWNLSRNRLAPAFFTAAKSEIVISAITAHATLNGFGGFLKSIASRTRICFLLLHPVRGRAELERWCLHENSHYKNMLVESDLTLRLIRAERYHSCFEFRFHDRLAPYTAVMIDGDIDHVENATDQDGQLRIHPLSDHSFGEKGGLIIRTSDHPERTACSAEAETAVD
jgi:hypothetical protein